ncbi:juvenile hormone acid O-methyltransferase-like [Ixodes scapularis]
MAVYFRSNRGGLKLLHEGFEYDKERWFKEKTYWQCSRKLECKARAHTIDEEVVKLINEHSHAPSRLDQEAKLAYSSMNERARTTEEPNQAIVGRLVAEMTPEACSYLPPQDTVKRTLRDQKAVFRNIGTLLKDDGECLLVFCAQFVLYNVWVEMSKMERWKNIIGDPRLTFADTWHDELSSSLDGLEKVVRRIVANAGMTTLSCEVYPTQSDFSNDELLLGLLVPLVTVKTGTTEEDKDHMREELSAKLLDGCTRTPEGSSYPLDLFFVHAQKKSTL